MMFVCCSNPSNRHLLQMSVKLQRASWPINSKINPNRFSIDKSLMIPGILHKCTLDSANLKQIGGLIKNSQGMVVGGGCTGGR